MTMCGFIITSQLPKVAELGWFFPTENQGKGCAYEAARLLIQFGFRSLLIDVFLAECATQNLASEKIMFKLGMSKESVFEKFYPTQGVSREKVRYNLLRLKLKKQ